MPGLCSKLGAGLLVTHPKFDVAITEIRRHAKHSQRNRLSLGSWNHLNSGRFLKSGLR